MPDAGTVTLTIETIHAAQAGDVAATEAVLRAMESRVQGIARSEARHMATSGYTEEFAQAARIAVWEALGRFTGVTSDEFFAYMHRTAATSVQDIASDERNPGADRDAMKSFSYWVKRCDGDLVMAEKLSQQLPDGYGRRLGRDRAHAARLAWQSVLSLDTPVFGGESDGDAEPSAGGYTEMLSSALGIPEDMIDSGDISDAKHRETVKFVNTVLEMMGGQTANVLRGTYGIEPMSYYGADNNEELGAALGITGKQVCNGRAKGFLQFAKKYVPLIANSDTLIAAEWWSAYQAERQRGNASTTRLKAKVAV